MPYKRPDLTGKKIGKLTVVNLDHVENEGRKIEYYNCQCDCGKSKIIAANYLTKSNPTTSCGCARKGIGRLDITGKRYGRLVALEFSHRIPSVDSFWFMKCDCGKVSVKRLKDLQKGNTTSCGCYAIEVTRERSLKHGHTVLSYKNTASRTYETWRAMFKRCYNPNHEFYSHYGARGITVCERWFKFENFLEDMGEKPEGLTIERILNDQGYYPGNVRWARQQEQLWNTRVNFNVTYRGETKCLGEWIHILTQEGTPPKVSSGGIQQRILKGWTPHDAFFTPSLTGRPWKGSQE